MLTFSIKYKPYHIEDFCLNDNFLLTLKTLHAIDDMNILFIGESNSGKTSLLYALIRYYYNLGVFDNFPDSNILLINNLKEQGINFFRNEMKTFCKSRSILPGKKKLIIIDDIDNINEQCQQVLRNYLDKYKHNVNFLAVCSNKQKINDSIQSRLHLLMFPSPTEEYLKKIMEKIIHQEGIIIDEESRKFLLLISNCSVRTLINNLEKIYILKKPITNIQLCKKISSIISTQLFENYISHLRSGQLTEAILLLYSIYDYGFSVIDIYDFIFSFFKTTELLTENEKYLIIPVLCKYITIFYNIHEDVIELSLFTNEIIQIISHVTNKNENDIK